MSNLVNREQAGEDEDHEAVFNDEAPQPHGGTRLRLVGRMFGDRDISKQAMVGMINRAWSHFCEPSVQDISKIRNTFNFIFNRKEEMDHAWEGRPWQISGNTLQLKQWEESVRPQNVNFDLADYWVQIHGIPDHKRTASNVESAVAMFPKIHGIDMRRLNPDKYMEFVRVFVQADLNRPLPPGSYCTFEGSREWLGFRYEKLYILCYYCGRQGHTKQECPKKRADAEQRIASPPEGRFTPWMKAGTRAVRPPPPPRGRVVYNSPGDAGSSSGSPGFVQNQLWIPGKASRATGSTTSRSPATPSDGDMEHGIRGPPGFTPHPFPTGYSASSPRSAAGNACHRFFSPSPDPNLRVYGALPFFSPPVKFNPHSPSSSTARNLSPEMEAAAWAHFFPQQANFLNGPYQAQQAHMQASIIQSQLNLQAQHAQANHPNVSQMVEELGKKMDLNRRPNEFGFPLPTELINEGQAEPKKRKHGQPLDFGEPYFSPGDDSCKPRNARMRVKGRKMKTTAEDANEEYHEEKETREKLLHNNSEAKVASSKPSGEE
ncbi:unnamed protein product [Linum trigynum]|uniref:CCHC-type domain-containing protein n=1 Tax=Linum trigynum TaxID=586398 RepID=A0AAV2DE23_9ROSI